MFISMNWISDFVDLRGLDIDELIHRFTLSTAEVEEVIHKGEDVQGVIAARIVSVENHPKSKKLHLLKVDTGKGIVDVVCGAPNVREGMVVALATEGGKAGGMDIGTAVIAGYESHGMCCSEHELGMSADHSGIMELPADTKLGTDIKKLFPIDDIVFEVENKSLTNRPDLWGHYGIAREFAAIAGRALKPIPTADLDIYNELPSVKVDVIDTEHCYRYSTIKVENVTERVSPAVMRVRLFYCGLRAINLLADITNYIMLELGQPMHAFDMRKVDKIEVKRFAEPFEFETLDSVTHTIDPDTMMICSGGEPVAIAGIMGGYDSEIADDTTSLLIESANFDGVNVRKSSARLAKRTDASMRYEKMLDPEMTVPALGRYIYLLSEIDPGIKVISSMTDVYVKRYPSITLEFDKKYVDRYTGINITKARIVKTLTALGFTVRCDKNNFSVDVPSWRSTKDVTIKADIIEEITRIYGYDNFEIKTTLSPLAPVRSSAARINDYAVKNLLCDAFGLHEVHSYLWCDAKKYKEIGIEVIDNPRLINSISADNILRRSMIPTQLVMLSDNKGFAPEYGIFEIGRVVEGLREDGTCNEHKKLGIAIYSRERSEKDLFMHLRELVSSLFITQKNCVPELRSCQEPAYKWQHPVNSADILCDGKLIGSFYTLTPEVAEKLDRKAAVVCAEIDMECFYDTAVAPFKYDEPSRFPGIDIDLSLVMENSRPYSDIADVIGAYDGELLDRFSLVDIYRSEALGENKVVTIRLSFSSPERTLSSEEVMTCSDDIVALLEEKSIMLKK